MRTAVRLDLAALVSRTGGPPVTRYAPSPTGYLHLGHVANAVYVWGLARATRGRVLLRIEDHDRLRCREVFETAILEDLDWLGFVPDGGRTPLTRQSDRHDRYSAALDHLTQAGRVYACACSRTRVGGEHYDGHCRHLALPRSSRVGLRAQLDDRIVPAHDARLGPLEQNPAEQCGDVLIRDRNGQWTYQFAVTVDDLRDGVTLVVRGEDLVTSTGRQVALSRLLGREIPPVFLHHPLLMAPGGRKLSKSAQDTGVRELRAQGLTPADVVGRAAEALGLLDAPRPVAASAVGELFDPVLPTSILG